MKKPPLGELEFNKLIEDNASVSSISGSSVTDGNPLSEADSADEQEGDEPRKAYATSKLHGAAIPQVPFCAKDGSHFAVWRCLLMQEQNTAAAAGQERPRQPAKQM